MEYVPEAKTRRLHLVVTSDSQITFTCSNHLASYVLKGWVAEPNTNAHGWFYRDYETTCQLPIRLYLKIELIVDHEHDLLVKYAVYGKADATGKMRAVLLRGVSLYSNFRSKLDQEIDDLLK